MRLGRTRLPIPPFEFEREWGNQLIRAIEQNFDSAFANIDNSAATTGYYGSFYDTTTQTAAAINTRLDVYGPPAPFNRPTAYQEFPPAANVIDYPRDLTWRGARPDSAQSGGRTL